MIKAIIFDFAGVIGADGYWVWLKENVDDIEAKRNYFQELSEKVDKGTITNKEFVSLLSEKTGVEKSNIWPAVYEKIKINEDLVNYIKQLKKKYKIGLLSNFTYEWLEEIFAKNNLDILFDAKFISSKYKMIKPEQKAFDKILELLGFGRDEAIFVDDRQGHVDAGNKLGVKSFLFTSNKGLQADIERHEIS